jgi:hypothetical protein
MNNKILARVVAVVLSVMMLGTVAFAAPVLNDGFGGFTDAEYGDGAAYGTQKTMVAFKAADENATAPASADDILAIGQGSDLNPASVTFDADKVPSTGYVIVAYGGDNGSLPVRTALEVATIVPDTEGAKITATAKSIFAADGVTFVRNAIEVTATLTATGTATEVGYKANVAGSSKVNEIKKDISGTTIEGGGSVTFNS